MEPGLVHRWEPFIPDREPPVAGEPREGSLDDPAMPPELLRRLHRLAGNPMRDLAPPTRGAALPVVVALVGVRLVGPMPWPPAPPGLQRGDRVEHRLEHHRVVDVGGAHAAGERDPVGVRNNMLLRARFAFIRRILAGAPAPLVAATLREAPTARFQSIWSPAARRSSSVRCNRFHTPRRCQARNRRQQVTPLPQPISCGKYSQGMPVW